ncbi:hypothetical protein DRQ53_10840 [bacterium]|nr:MAG: hypothetical protein DRQ53_10840 [bacterium]
MRIIAFVQEAEVVEKILRHIGEPVSPPASLPARSPPQGEFGFGQVGGAQEWVEMDQTVTPGIDTWDWRSAGNRGPGCGAAEWWREECVCCGREFARVGLAKAHRGRSGERDWSTGAPAWLHPTVTRAWEGRLCVWITYPL